MNNAYIGGLLVVLAGAVLGSAGALVKSLDLPVFMLIAFRVVIPCFLGLLCQPSLIRKIVTERKRNMLLASSCTALRVSLWVLAFIYATMSRSVLVLHTWPLFFTFFSFLFLGEEVSKRDGMILGIASLGIVLLFTDTGHVVSLNEPLGLTLMLGVAVLNGIIMTIFKHELAGRSVWEVVVYDNLIGMLVGIPYLLFFGGTITPERFLSGIIYGTLIGFVGYLLLYAGMRKLPASTVAVLIYTEVISATIFGVTLFGEELTPGVLLGGGLIIASVLVVRLKPRLPFLSRSRGTFGPS